MAGTCIYVIGVIHDNSVWYYAGDKESKGGDSEPQYSSALADATRYDDIEILRDQVYILPFVTCKILEIQKCPKCGAEFTDHPAISREDNETEICPSCGVREAVEAYAKANNLTIE